MAASCHSAAATPRPLERAVVRTVNGNRHTVVMKKISGILRQQSGQARIAILLATALAALLPFLLANDNSPLPHGFSNKAEAAYDAAGRIPEDALAAGRETIRGRQQYGRAVRSRLERDPAAFLDLGEADLIAALSHPSLKRTDGAAQMWQYRSGVCVLDVFMQDGNIVHYEMRSPGKAVLRAATKTGAPAPDRMACIRTLTRT